MNDDRVLDDLVEPLRAHLNLLDSQLAQLNVERDELMARRAKVRKTLDFLDPQEKGAVKGKLKHTHTPEENVRAVQAFIESRNGALDDGFNPTELYRLITANGEPLIGKEQVRRSVLTLHERGYLRLDRVGQGGSKVYKVVAGG